MRLRLELDVLLDKEYKLARYPAVAVVGEKVCVLTQDA
jgi:hypothetical protein